METRRLMLAAFLSALIIVVWQTVFPPVPPVDSAPAENSIESVTSETTDPTSRAVDGPDAPSSSENEPTSDSEVDEVEPLEIVAAQSEETIEIETERAVVRFTNKGAMLTSYELKQHSGDDGEDLDLVRKRGKDLSPFAIVSGQGGSKLNSALWVWERGVDENGDDQLIFRHSSDAGVAEKSFSWDRSGFMNVRARIQGSPGWGLLLGPGLNNEESRSSYGQTIDRVVGYKRGSEQETIPAGKQEESTFLSARSLNWITLEDNFFLVAAVPKLGVGEVEARPVLQRPTAESGIPRFLPIDSAASEDDLRKELFLVLSADREEMEVLTYFGAKTYSYLSQQPYGLEETVRWGTYLGFLAKPLYIVLEWIHTNLEVNYGIAIILVTFLLKLCFFPLTHKSQESMGKMQELNPKIQGIRNRYKSKLRDKQGRPNVEAQKQMNEEVMAVYRSAGVNPASGCLPMLLQMPVFFAFFRLLTTAVELRGAEWMLWIEDLSQPDPYYLLPLLMGVTSLGMQKMMPMASADPMQRRIMQMMPIMFTAFAFTFPSGLVLYWLTNNVLTMGQQLLINKQKARKESAAA